MTKPIDSDSRRSGFTILEVLVSVAILAMIATIIFGTFFYTVSNAELLEDRAALYGRASYILGSVSQSVSSAYAPYAGQVFDEEDERSVFHGGGGDPLFGAQVNSLSTYTLEPRFTGEKAGAEIAYVTYEVLEPSEAEGTPGWIEDENNPLVFACTVEPLLALSNGADETFDQALPQWMLNVRSVRFEFFDGSEWLGEWSFEEQESFPLAVKVELELGDSDGESHMFSTLANVHANAFLQEPPEVLDEVSEEEEEEEEAEETAEEAEEDDEGEVAEESEEPNPFEPGDGGGGGIFPDDPGGFPFGFEYE